MRWHGSQIWFVPLARPFGFQCPQASTWIGWAAKRDAPKPGINHLYDRSLVKFWWRWVGGSLSNQKKKSNKYLLAAWILPKQTNRKFFKPLHPQTPRHAIRHRPKGAVRRLNASPKTARPSWDCALAPRAWSRSRRERPANGGPWG